MFISDLWLIQPNRQLGLYVDIHESKIQGYAQLHIHNEVKSVNSEEQNKSTQ